MMLIGLSLFNIYIIQKLSILTIWINIIHFYLCSVMHRLEVSIYIDFEMKYN
jgi:hypothetical protein